LAFPDPQPGLVIRYAYLWRSEANRGQEEGVKDRPCAVVLAVKQHEDKITVVVAPITHTPPADLKTAIELPSETKRRLGLDDDRSWIIANDLNYFTWPGPDLRLADPGKPQRGIAYGLLPFKITQQLIRTVILLRREGRTKTVNRD